MSVNKVILVGRLGKDPEVKTTPSGMTITKFSLATDERFTDKSGQKQDRTEWHNIVMFGKLAEISGQYLRKGKQVYLEGSIRTDSWEDKESGQKKYRTEIIISEMKMLGSRGEDEGGSSGGYGGGQRRTASVGSGSSSMGGDNDFEDDDEVPF